MMSLMSSADLLRLAIFASGALVTGAVLAVIRLHLVAVRRAPSDNGLLPRHVLAVSAAHLFYTVGVAMAVLEQIGQPDFSPRLWFYLTGNLLTLLALWLIGRSQRRRVRRPPTRVVPHGPRHRRGSS